VVRLWCITTVGDGGDGRAEGDGMVLMTVVALLLVAGVVLTLRWGGAGYQPWAPQPGPQPEGARLPASAVAVRYLRGAAVGLTGGFWAGLLVTGPAVRLAMRLLAVTGGDDAQGRITEAEEVVGSISLDGTIGLVLFGGVLPGLLSGAIYVVVRRLLPAGRLGGVAFGALHLLVAATRIDPLRPDNPDFDVVGPGWLSLTVFGLAAVVHGMAVAAYVDRYSHDLPPGATARADLDRAAGAGSTARPAATAGAGGTDGPVATAGAGTAAGVDGAVPKPAETTVRRRRARAVLPLVPPALLLIPGVGLLVPVVAGLVVTVVLSRVGGLARLARSDAVVLAGRVALASLALVCVPGAVADLHDVVVRDDGPAASTAGPFPEGG
jgi:hypothetical protein